MDGSDTDEIIKELFRSLLQRYQENLQEKMKGSDFAFDGVNYLYYDLNKISISKGGSYIDSPKWLKDKKSTINPKNNDFKCFQYADTLALNLDKINNHPERISKIKPVIEEYNWKDIDFPSTSKDWKKFELNNEIAQIKTIEDQGKKQVKAIQNNKQLVNINNDDDDYEDKLLLSKEREIFKDIYNKRLDKIEELNNKIDYNSLNYVVAGTGDKYSLDDLDDPLTFLNNIKKGEISIKKL